MFYRLSDPKTSTSDWFSLSCDAIPQVLIKPTDADGDEVLREIVTAPELDTSELYVEPFGEDGDDGLSRTYDAPDLDEYTCDVGGAGMTFNTVEAATARHAADKAKVEKHNVDVVAFRSEREGQDILPMWGTMWHVEDHPEIRSALATEGLRVYEHDEINGLLFGVEGCGYDFYGAHWIPLRARLALAMTWPSGGGPLLTGAKLGRFLKTLRTEASKLGDADKLERVIAELRPGLEKPARVRGRKAA